MAFAAAIAQRQRVVVRQLAPDRATQVSFLRFLHNSAVTVPELLAAQAHQTGLATYTGHVRALTDTTALDLRRHARRLDPATVGPIGPAGRGLGLLLHPTLCLAAEADAPRAVLGVSSLQYWHRPPLRPAPSTRTATRPCRWPRKSPSNGPWRASRPVRPCPPPASRWWRIARVTITRRWRSGSGPRLCGPLQGRRRLVSSSDKLFTHLAQQPAQAHWEQVVARQKATVGEPTPQARLTLRFRPLTLQRPVTAPGQVAQLACWAVSVTEDAPPPGEKPIVWRLLTSPPLPDVATAQQVVNWYAQRWWIEHLFRVLKQQDLRLEDTQLRDGAAIACLLVVALPTAVQVMQLVQARQQPDPAPPSVLPAAARELARHWVRQLEGNTVKQRNPHPPDSLAWGAWLYARLGGWNGLPSERPPGVITLCRGATRFQQFFDDWLILAPLVYKP